jgi:hypothetical protein
MGCIDNIIFGTTFNEKYDFYRIAGDHTIELVFDNPRDIIDLKKNGI